MTETYSIIIFLSILFLFLGSGVWIGASLLITAIVGMFMFTSRPIGDAMAITIWSGQSSWTLTALPLFIWMGEILFRTRLSETLFKGLSPFLGKLPGGLLHVNIGASAIFAAISGSSAATVATVGKMSIPELRKRKYPEKMIIGTLSGAGTLGLLIPPSISMIIYGVTVNESIAQLFMASMIPGIALAACFMTYVIVWALISGQKFDEGKIGSFSKILTALLDLCPVLLLICAVIGSIYSGIATATEAAALGVIGSILLALYQKSLNFSAFTDSVLGAVKTTAMIMFILMGSSFLSLAMGFTGLPKALATTIVAWELSPYALIVILTIFYIVLGMFLDGISSIVLTMAVIEPMVRAAGFDMLWFGVYLMIVVEMAQITPPIGFNLFVLQGMTGKDLGYIARASMPMFFVMCAFVGVLVMVPELATWLPSVLK
ncbi:MAG: TRAP transporter large permease subunit [Methylocystaceae bacterium]|nr:TRAP transporter large permease subunit [Methylocystaceae bacterium]